VLRGDMVRVKRGAFCERNVWDALSDRERHLMRIFAVAERTPHALFSHWSAAAIHDLETLLPLPADVFVTTDRASGGRSEPGIRRSCTGVPHLAVMRVGQLRVTTVERTIADLALLASFGAAVASADAALRRGFTDRTALERHLDLVPRERGAQRIARVIRFASPLADNPGESLSRAVLHELGAPAPRLQVEHRMADGSRLYPDFEWPRWNVIGEFDGRGKYLKPELRNGRSPGQVVYDEKRREDRLRGMTGASFARWGWDEVNQPEKLRRILAEAGLPFHS
jgi:hypothetical protein